MRGCVFLKRIHNKITRFQARSRDGRCRSWTRLKFAQKRSWVWRWSWAEQQLDVFCFKLFKLFVNSGATDIVLWLCPAQQFTIAQCTSHWAMARGHRLSTSFVLAAVHGLSGLFRAVSAVEPSLSHPLPTLSPSPIGHFASVDVKHHERKNKITG